MVRSLQTMVKQFLPFCLFVGFHENVVGYYNSWFENEQLYIQLELCDHSLSKKSSLKISEREILVIMHQVHTSIRKRGERERVS